MAFFVHRSNRLDLLVQALAQVVREPAQPLEPLRPETIVVQSRALGRYLSYSLARTLGVWACPEFPFPRRTIDLVLGAVLGDSAEAELSVFTEARMTWALARTIPKCLEEEPEVFSPVRQYLTVETGPWPVGTRPNAEEAPRPVGARLMSLSAQLAAVFDRYLAYRPEWILAWDRAPEEHWQSRLWHRLVRDYTSPGAPRPSHLAARAQAFFEAVGDLGAPPEGLAPRLHLFGIRTLSPLFLRIFASLGHVVELHFYHLAPSSEYFADLRPSDLLSEAGSSNPLLGSMGRLGRDLQDMLEEHDYEEAGSSFLDPAPELALLTNVERESSHPALAVVQSDVLHLRSRRPGDASGARPLLLRPDDRSISVHACFGPMREVEALRDQLLAAFEELPGLSPRDVAVMAPSMDAYAPYVEAVFGVPPDDPAFVPYSIADRHPRTEQALVDAFLALVELLPTRLTGPEVLEVLSRAPIRERFGIPPEGMEILTEWLDAAGIRWAVDARDRAAQGQPALDEYTWRFGLDRLLLGFAASGDQWTTFAGRVPLQGAEGAPGLLGSLLEFSEALFEAHRESLLPARPAKWQERLLGWLEGMFHAGDEHAWQRQSLRDAFEGLATDASLAGFDGALELADLRFLLEARVGQPSPPREFLSSGISFCSLLPMRSVPFRVIALLGLSEEQFPRQDRRVGFDLMAEAPRPGDPSPRQDDRYLFLETMLAARDRLILSYVGGDLRDQTARPPSVLVSELLDVLGESFVVPEEREREPASGPEPARERRRRMAERLVVRHSLRPFDPRYFGGPGPGELFTFNRSLLATARAHLGPKRPAAPFLAEPLPPPSLGNRGEVQAASASPAELTLPLDSLERFWRLPAEQLMRGRLGLSSPGEEPSLSHREPASIESGLHAYQVRDSLLGRFRASGSIDGAWEALLGAALLPLGEPGRAALEGEEARMKPLLGFLAPFRTETPLSPVPLALPLGPSPSSAGALFGGAGVMRLAGWLRGLLPGAQLMARPGEVRPKDQLAAWLRHLALSALGDPRLPGVTIVAGAGGRGLAVHWFERVEPERAIELLRELAVLFWDGQRVPLRFFPGTSLAYAEGLSKGAEAALASARAVFLPSGGAAPSDSEDPYVARFFRGAEVLEEPEGLGPEGLPSTDHAFASLAIRVWGPLLEARREGPP